MSNRLEDFVNSNRDAFDNEAPTDQVWNSIQGRLNPGLATQPAAKVVRLGWIKWAAAAAVILVTGTILFIRNEGKNPRKQHLLPKHPFSHLPSAATTALC